MLVLLSLGLEGFFLVCLRTLENATFMCCSTVVRWKYMQDEPSNTELEGKAYSFRVRCCNSAGVGEPSEATGNVTVGDKLGELHRATYIITYV